MVGVAISAGLAVAGLAHADNYCTPTCWCSGDPAFIQTDVRSVPALLLMRLCPRPLRDKGVRTIYVAVGDNGQGTAIFVTPEGRQARVPMTEDLCRLYGRDR